MFIVKKLLKVLLLPVFFVLFFIRWLLDTAIELAGWAIGLLMLITGAGIVYYLFCKRWSDVFLMSVIFAGVVVILAASEMVKGLCDNLMGMIITL